MLAFEKEEEEQRDYRRRKKKLRELEKKRLRRKRQDIGSYAWYFKESVRDDWDARHPPKTIEDIAAEEILEQEVVFKETEAGLEEIIEDQGEEIQEKEEKLNEYEAELRKIFGHSMD